MIVVPISAFMSWKVISEGHCWACACRLKTFGTITLEVAALGLVLVLLSVVSIYCIFFLDFAFSRATDLFVRPTKD
jgi:hypothetical protein